jgi:predicted transcriptional regulator
MKGDLAHLMREGFFEKICRELRDQPVSTIMRTDLIQIGEEDSLISVVADIVKYRLVAIPVTRGKTLVGTIHKKGLLSYAAKVLIEDNSQDANS